MTPVAHIQISLEQEVLQARQQARLIAEMLGFDRQDQTRISTAVSEIARSAHQHGQGGEAEVFIQGMPPAQLLVIAVRDVGPDSPEALLKENTLVGCRQLLDDVQIRSEPGQGTTVTLTKSLPATAPPVTPALLERMTAALASLQAQSPLLEVRRQNQELLATLELVSQRDEQLSRLNSELTTTNTGIVALYNDLEDKSQQLQQSEQRLRVRNEELKGFAYTVSHDLKAPLRGIGGYAQELDRKHKEGLSQRALFCVSQILAATRNLDRLIEDLLSFARLDAEFPSLTQVNPRNLMETILKDRSLAIAEEQAEITVDIPSTTLWSWERGLVQVLTNLIDNALKYSAQTSPPRISIKAEEADNHWHLVVRDNGIGFDMKYHDRIFGLFNRLVRADQFEGTGAGLAIVRKVLDKLGGSIWAESQPGQGATFHVTLPVVVAS